MFLQVDSLQQLRDNPGFWDNYVWPLAVTITIAIFSAAYLLLKRFWTKSDNFKPKVVFNLKINNDGLILLDEPRDIESKLFFARQLVRSGSIDLVEVIIKPDFKLSAFDKYRREEINLKLVQKCQSIKQRLEILLLKPIEHRLEIHGPYLLKVFQNILNYPSPNVTGLIKIDIYRNQSPEIYFPIHLTQDEFEKMAIRHNKSVSVFKNELCIPTLHSMSILDDDILFRLAIPALIREIFRIKTQHNFQLSSPHWENIMLYEIGLG
jgi:hypothetical protein